MRPGAPASHPAYRGRPLPPMRPDQKRQYFALRKHGLGREEALLGVADSTPEVRVTCRRCRSELKPKDVTFICGPLTLNFAKRKVEIDDKPIRLRSQHMLALELLMRNQGEVCTNEQLFDAMSYHALDVKNIVKVTICRIRRALGPHASMIKTVWGVGYTIQPPENGG